MDYNPDETYILTAPRTRANWRELFGNMPVNKSKRFRRGEKLADIPEEQIARLVALGHAVPESEYDPEAIKRVSAARRLAMTNAAAADAKAAVDNAKSASGLPLVGLEDSDSPKSEKSEERTSDGVPVTDIEDVPDADADGDAADLANVAPGDGLEDKSYPELQKLAKDETGNGGGSTPELIERIRAHRAEQ